MPLPFLELIHIMDQECFPVILAINSRRSAICLSAHSFTIISQLDQGSVNLMMHSVGCIIGSHRVVKLLCGPVEFAVVVIGFGVTCGLNHVSNLMTRSVGKFIDNCTNFFLVDNCLKTPGKASVH